MPVATWVTPAGARAASAGTYILLASHVAAMNAATHVGAATPVSMIGTPARSPAGDTGNEQDGEAGVPASQDTASESGQGEADRDRTDGQPDTQAPSDAMSRKILNDAVAYIRGLATRHGRNADWAEKAVREADSITSEVALATNVIDFIAEDIESLLSKAHGRTVRLAGAELTLQTEGLRIVQRDPGWRSELLAVITNPTIAYILLLVGFYGLLLEGYNPGAFVPGVVGAISLLLALYALQMLPVNYAGLALIVLGLVLIIAETLAPSFGVLGIGGVIALVIGSIILMDTDVPGFQVSSALIAGIALASSALMLGIVVMAMRARSRPLVTGQEQMIGTHGTAAAAFDSEGKVYISGELWSAVSEMPVGENQAVEVTGLEGLTLQVKPLDGPHE